MIIALEILLIILIAGSIVFYIACALCTRQFFASKQEIEQAQDPPVSVLIPVCGLDEGAWENWTSFCQQNYPNYEVLFGVTNPDDQAVPILEKLVATFSDRVKIFVGLEPRGINHKDSNLSYLLEASRHEVIIFADSDIRVSADYIRTITAPLVNPEIGLVTCAFIGYNPQSLEAALASFGRCVDFIPSALIARVLDGGFRFAIGATMATRKSTLAKFGGLQLNRIGSDYNLGKRAAASGYRVELSQYVLDSDTSGENLWQLFQREVRWARTIRYNRGAVYYLQVFCYGTVYCLPLLLLSGFAAWAIALCTMTLIVRYIQALIAISSLNSPKLLAWLWILPLRDLLSLIVWAIGTFGQRVYWRGRWLRVEADGLIKQWQ
jgi:ceramide glucosyltransferase